MPRISTSISVVLFFRSNRASPMACGNRSVERNPTISVCPWEHVIVVVCLRAAARTRFGPWPHKIVTLIIKVKATFIRSPAVTIAYGLPKGGQAHRHLKPRSYRRAGPHQMQWRLLRTGKFSIKTDWAGDCADDADWPRHTITGFCLETRSLQYCRRGLGPRVLCAITR